MNENNTADFRLDLPVFSGPMDLLLALIEKHKIDIYDIPMAVVTGEYLDYLAKMKEFAIEPASEFLVMAATLLLIKSRMMLPKAKAEAADEGNGGEAEDNKDPRSELITRIIEYRRFKEAAAHLSGLFEAASRFVPRQESDFKARRQLDAKFPISGLFAALSSLIAAKQAKPPPAYSIYRERYTVKERMGYIATRLRQLGKNGAPVKFTALFAEIDREECITTFLALLELVKLGEAVAEQQKSFAEIVIYAID